MGKSRHCFHLIYHLASGFSGFRQEGCYENYDSACASLCLFLFLSEKMNEKPFLLTCSPRTREKRLFFHMFAPLTCISVKPLKFP